jgi:hypothetical protein
MSPLRSAIGALSVAALAGLLIGAASHRSTASHDEIRIETLRHFAEPAADRLVTGPEGDALRSRLVELDRVLQALAPIKGSPPVKSFRTIPTSAELGAYRAWIERSRPVLASWVRLARCEARATDGNPRSIQWIPLRDRIETYWDRGQRIAMDPPRLPVLRRAANLFAWRAAFDAATTAKDRDECEIEPAEILASILTLAYAYDDSSLIGTMARITVEEQTLQAARLMLEQGTLSASDLRRALEPALARSAAFEPREMIEGEMRAFLALYDRVASDGLEAVDHFASIEEAFELAQRPSVDPNETSAADDEFLRSCRGALARVHRHRSIVTTWRVALALMEHRERDGAFPERLEELAAAFEGEFPRDPVTDAPIAYRVDGSRALLGPTACPMHGEEPCRHVEWPVAVEQMLAWDLESR